MALNLKFRITGDASGVKKATKEASAAVKSFEKEGKGALSSLGSALGINISSIERMGDAFAGAVLKMRGGADRSRASSWCHGCRWRCRMEGHDKGGRVLRQHP